MWCGQAGFSKVSQCFRSKYAFLTNYVRFFPSLKGSNSMQLFFRYSLSVFLIAITTVHLPFLPPPKQFILQSAFPQPNKKLSQPIPCTIIIMLVRILLCTFILLSVAKSNPIIRIPLTYAFDWDLTTKLPIDISFSHSNIYSTRPTKHLFLLGHNLSAPVKNFPTLQPKDRVEIGLKFPSDFVASLSKTYGVSYQAVELQKQNYLSALVFDDNYVESWDVWQDGAAYKVHVKYNFGDDLMIDNKPMSLIEGEIVYFEEYLIREVLNRMTKENEINFRFNEETKTVQLMGKVENLPQLTIVKGDYIFKIKLGENTLHYIPAIQNKQRMTLVGYKALHLFNKMKFRKSGEIIFKRTSLVYQLYLFLIYFTCLLLFLVYLIRKSLHDSSQFVKHILRWVFFKDRASRVEVLKSELE